MHICTSKTDYLLLFSYNPITIVAALLSVDVETLKKVVTTRKMVAGNETYTIPMKPSQCAEARDSLAMLLYAPRSVLFIHSLAVGIRDCSIGW